jgi:hypothetical protein
MVNIYTIKNRSNNPKSIRPDRSKKTIKSRPNIVAGEADDMRHGAVSEKFDASASNNKTRILRSIQEELPNQFTSQLRMLIVNI